MAFLKMKKKKLFILRTSLFCWNRVHLSTYYFINIPHSSQYYKKKCSLENLKIGTNVQKMNIPTLYKLFCIFIKINIKLWQCISSNFMQPTSSIGCWAWRFSWNQRKISLNRNLDNAHKTWRVQFDYVTSKTWT